MVKKAKSVSQLNYNRYSANNSKRFVETQWTNLVDRRENYISFIILKLLFLMTLNQYFRN